MNKRRKTILKRVLVLVLAIVLVSGLGLARASDRTLMATSVPEETTATRVIAEDTAETAEEVVIPQETDAASEAQMKQPEAPSTETAKEEGLDSSSQEIELSKPDAQHCVHQRHYGNRREQILDHHPNVFQQLYPSGIGNNARSAGMQYPAYRMPAAVVSFFQSFPASVISGQ